MSSPLTRPWRVALLAALRPEGSEQILSLVRKSKKLYVCETRSPERGSGVIMKRALGAPLALVPLLLFVVSAGAALGPVPIAAGASVGGTPLALTAANGQPGGTVGTGQGSDQGEDQGENVGEH